MDVFYFMVVLAGFCMESIKAEDLIERFENFTKRPNDGRYYRGLKLSNEMKVILISDPSAVKSAASMSVGVGSMNDDHDAPGLATLVSHMLLKGSGGYSKPNSFKTFLEKYQSDISPLTYEDKQIFSFQIDSDHFLEALQRFAHFFIDPLIAYDTELPLNDSLDQILSDYKKRLGNDDFRILEVEKSMSKKKHLYNHFFVLDTKFLEFTKPGEVVLNIPQDTSALYKSVHDFYSRWYSSNIMCLAVLGRESLDILEDIVITLFENVENKDVPKIVYGHKFHPWGQEELGYKVYIVPQSPNVQVLRVNFPTPDIRELYKTVPDTYIGHLIANKKPGSLFSVLKMKNWCTGFGVMYSCPAGIGFYTIICDLTNNGVQHVDDIVNVIFQYIRMIKTDGVRKWVFDETKNISKANFLNYNSSTNGTSLAFVRSLVSNMQSVSIEKALWLDFLRGTIEWDSSAVTDFLTYLKPDKINISIVSQSFQRKVDRVEQYYGTRYFKQKISEELIKKWNTEDPISDLQLPTCNEFVPENFDLFPVDKKESKHPHIIHQSPISEVWFQQDEQFRTPKLHIHFELISSINRIGPLERNLWRLFHTMLIMSLNKDLFNVQAVGFPWVNWNIPLLDYGLQIKISTYNDKLPLLLDRILSKVLNFVNEVNEETFEHTLEYYTKNLNFVMAKDRIFQANWYRRYVLCEGSWSTDNISSFRRVLQFHDMKRFLSKIFRRIFIRGFIHGNCTRQMAANIVNIAEKYFHTSNGLLLQEMLWPRFIEIAAGSHSVYQSFSEEHDVSTYNFHFQFDTDPLNFENVMGPLLFIIIKDKCLEVHQDQSAATIHCMFYNNPGALGFLIIACLKKDMHFINSEIESFLDGILNAIKNMSNAIFEFYKRKVPSFKNSGESLTLSELSEKYWDEISNRFYHFDKTAQESHQLSSLRKKKFATFAAAVLGKTSPLRRQFVIEIRPKEKKKVSSNLELINYRTPKGKKNDDIFNFKLTSTLLPLNFCSIPSKCIKI